MGLGRFRRNLLRERVLLWLLPALVFRALIPVGFMPGVGQSLTLELCSSVGYVTSVVHFGADGLPVEDPQGGHGDRHSPCAFAASATAAPAPSAAMPTLPPAATPFSARRGSAILPGAPSLYPTARGPPHLA